MKKLVSLIVLTLLLVGCSRGIKQSSDETNNQSENQSVTTSMTEQNLDFMLKDKDGNDVRLSDFKGKRVYLNVWASWCGHCKAELPELEATYQAFKDNDDYVFLSVTSPSDEVYANNQPADSTKETILETAEKAGVTYPVLFDTKDQAMTNLSISAFPTHYFINGDGTIHDVQLGGLTQEDLTKFLEEMK